MRAWAKKTILHNSTYECSFNVYYDIAPNFKNNLDTPITIKLVVIL